MAAEAALETTRIRLAKYPALCRGPQFIAEHLLRAEGFSDTQYLSRPGFGWSQQALATGEIDIGVNYAFQFIRDESTGARYTSAPLHKFTLWVELRSRLGIDLGASAHAVSSQRWIEPNYDPTSPTGFAAPPLPVPASVVVIGRIGYRLMDDKLEFGLAGTNLTDFGSRRHREHPYANRVEARLVGSLTARF